MKSADLIDPDVPQMASTPVVPPRFKQVSALPIASPGSATPPDDDQLRQTAVETEGSVGVPPAKLVLLHIGYHKTGSTWLQRRVFDRRDIADSPFLQPWNSIIIDSLVMPHPLHFDAVRARRLFASGVEQAREMGRVPVISAERLSGNPHSGGHDSTELARRLFAVFPQGRVLLVVREQAGAILSGWRQYVQVGGPCSLPRYLNPPHAGRARIPWFRWEHFEYDRLVQFYFDLFGRDRVLVLTHEQLSSDPNAFVDCIFAHAGIARPDGYRVASSRVNQSMSDIVLAIKRPLNAMLVRDGVNPAGLVDSQRFSRRLQVVARLADRLVPSAIRTALHRRARRYVERTMGDRYVASNRRLAALLDRDLGAEGYQV